MRVLMVTIVLACFAVSGLAQTNPPAKPADRADKQPGKGGQGKGRAAPKSTRDTATTEALTSCIAMWEKSTHMSRQEWDRACRRVANRIQNLNVK